MQTHHQKSDCGKLVKAEAPYSEPYEEEKSSLAEKVLHGRGDSLEKYRLKHQNYQAAEEAKPSEHQLVTPVYNDRQTAIRNSLHDVKSEEQRFSFGHEDMSLRTRDVSGNCRSTLNENSTPFAQTVLGTAEKDHGKMTPNPFYLSSR